jgi:hypothetical protein
MAKTKTEGTKKPVSMVLKQDQSRHGRELSDNEKEKVYQSFRNRVLEKSEHNYVDLGEEPKLLRLYMLGSKFNSTVEFLVKVGSFKPIMGSSKGTENTEIGFTIELKSPLRRKTHTLEVLRRQFRATLIIPD